MKDSIASCNVDDGQNLNASCCLWQQIVNKDSFRAFGGNKKEGGMQRHHRSELHQLYIQLLIVKPPEITRRKATDQPSCCERIAAETPRHRQRQKNAQGETERQ